MGSGDIPLVLLAAAAALAAAALGGIDAALTRVSRVSVEEFVRQARPGSRKLAQVVADPGRYLALLLLLRIMGEMVAAACVTIIAAGAYGTGFGAVFLGAALATLVSYVLVGVMFRTLGRQHAPTVALAGAGLTVFLARIFGPLPRLLIAFGNAVTPGKGYRDGPFASEAELRDLVDLAEENDVIEPAERDMIASVFELGDTLVREVMVPRPDMVFIEATKSIEQAISLALRGGFSRVPVIGESVDDVVGIAFLKDLVGRERDGGGDAPVEEAMRPPALVPESKPADDLLREMQASRTHMAIVIDEYGGTAGLVTIEDILEEIVGEIVDEYDTALPPVEWLDGHTARVTARLEVEDLAKLFGVDEEDLPGVGEVETVGGLLARALGRVPIPGATASVGGLSLTAERAAGRRNQIGTVVVHRQAAGGDHADAGRDDDGKAGPAGEQPGRDASTQAGGDAGKEKGDERDGQRGQRGQPDHARR
ncbi:HlyC/CorC family transporter [Frankia sp. CNm7]|uniref:HlyC/CorC family transporter n=1 Tax=Frankia nepalensis TaxID=1836974 RepID=A0A937RTE6_9ACTN|nr:hemolysin family protein [Frankia nepalensis]MBL7500142.1 HlyC/CorC family transporter [Frankia nepalensis]MBL7511174.1 HlyC/CorC family transporter [Frankia nepalensis]MBL7522170.1 HlyC/CorC family transporter [Frankia nepalensis]MBL7631586.1 HlyC/CorC family transporter [Frankia nepalensis]